MATSVLSFLCFDQKSRKNNNRREVVLSTGASTTKIKKDKGILAIYNYITAKEILSQLSIELSKKLQKLKGKKCGACNLWTWSSSSMSVRRRRVNTSSKLYFFELAVRVVHYHWVEIHTRFFCVDNAWPFKMSNSTHLVNKHCQHFSAINIIIVIKQ